MINSKVLMITFDEQNSSILHEWHKRVILQINTKL